MLRKTSCEHFSEGAIEFHDGLNVVLGDAKSTNSIGKSTLLMIVDFAHGGDSYITKNGGAVKELGEHHFNFEFVFNGKSLYVSRDTADANTVHLCDSTFKRETPVSNDQYCQILKENFKLDGLRSSFRAIVSLYSRIWQKENYNVDKPLHTYPKEKDSDAITNLIKLFERYEGIAEIHKKIKESSQFKKAIDGLYKENFVKKIGKTEHKQNEIKLKEFQDEIADIKENLLKYTVSIEELTSKDVIETKRKRERLFTASLAVKNRIERIDLNLQRGSTIKSKHLELLSTFFDNTNTDKIAKIEEFHSRLSTILTEELKLSKSKLDSQLKLLEKQIADLDAKLASLLAGVKTPKYIVDKVYSLTVDSNRIERENDFFEKKKGAVENIKETQEELDKLITSILNDITLLINNSLLAINQEVHGETKKSPSITLTEKSYKFDHFNNTGTGKSYVDLLIFDISVFSLSRLPILIHDSFLFKNIEDFSVDKLITKYSSLGKQMFIAIDGITKYSDASQKILVDKACVVLSNEKLLFKKDWR